MVKINVYGNAYAYKMSYKRGQHLVSPQVAKRLVDYGVAEILSSEVQTATLPEPKVRTAVIENKPVQKKKRKK